MGYTSAQAKEFINHIAPIIQAEALKRGYHTCASVIAQAVIEGAAGTSGLAKYHNHFGLKCGTSWKGASVNMRTKEEYTPGTLTTIKDNFRAYASDQEGVAGYYDFISTKRYANLKAASNYKVYAQWIKDDGYATSSTYVNTLCSTVAKYGLDKYDEIFDKTSNNYFDIPPRKTSSIVEALEMINADSSKEYRRTIWNANDMMFAYEGSAPQNQKLLSLLYKGELKRP